MLRKSPYIQENFDRFFTKEWDRSNSLLNSQESITQALNFMQNLRLDHFDNSPAKGNCNMIEDNRNADMSINFNQSQQMKQSTGVMVDISSQVIKSTRMAENNNKMSNLNNKRSINYSAFDQTSNMLLQGNQDLFAQKKPFVDDSNNIMKQILENDNHTSSTPQFCSYCKLHYDQVLLLKRQQDALNCKENNNYLNKKFEQKNKLDQFFTKKQKISSQISQAVNMQQQNFNNNMMNSSTSNQIQQTLYKFSTSHQGNKEIGLNNIPANNFTHNNNFNVQPMEQDSEKLFQKCNECNRYVCFKCCKQCQRCENIICPLPLCTTVIYEQHEDVILCSKCVNVS